MKTIVQLVSKLKDYLLGKDTDAKQAVESNIAPVEADASSASQAYVVGEQLILNDVLYDVTSSISVGDAIAVGTNITPASKLSADIQTLTNEIADMNNVLGAKNLLPNNAVTQVKSGITFTVNSDGSIRLTGTATAAVSIDLPVDLTDGVTYTASGISGGSQTTYQVYLQTADGLSTSHGVIYDGEFTFTKNNGQTYPNNDVHIYRIRVSSGVTVDTVIYPMIRLASITDNTYVPYAKSNKELTDEKLDISSLKTITAASSDFADFKTRIAAL